MPFNYYYIFAHWKILLSRVLKCYAKEPFVKWNPNGFSGESTYWQKWQKAILTIFISVMWKKGQERGKLIWYTIPMQVKCLIIFILFYVAFINEQFWLRPTVYKVFALKSDAPRVFVLVPGRYAEWKVQNRKNVPTRHQWVHFSIPNFELGLVCRDGELLSRLAGFVLHW